MFCAFLTVLTLLCYFQCGSLTTLDYGVSSHILFFCGIVSLLLSCSLTFVQSAFLVSP